MASPSLTVVHFVVHFQFKMSAVTGKAVVSAKSLKHKAFQGRHGRTVLKVLGKTGWFNRRIFQKVVSLAYLKSSSPLKTPIAPLNFELSGISKKI